MINIKQLKTLHGWHYLNRMASSFPISGWKLHIFGATIEDSHVIGTVMEPILLKYSLTMKIATQSVISAGIGDKLSNQYGKAGTIYISPQIFRDKRIGDLIKEIQEAFKTVGYVSNGIVNGDKSIDGILHYRYELSKVVDPEVGVTYDEYIRAYEPNRGHYNIPENPDISELFNK